MNIETPEELALSLAGGLTLHDAVEEIRERDQQIANELEAAIFASHGPDGSTERLRALLDALRGTT